MSWPKKVVQSFFQYLMIGMILGVIEYVLSQDKIISDLDSLLQAFFNTNLIPIMLIVWGDAAIRIYRERNPIKH